uniref:Uncharacterized protein n=1 Tax=Anguilla anguilla TaxID=7936 RepID=A0A0E9XN35_ANGAN
MFTVTVKLNQIKFNIMNDCNQHDVMFLETVT